VPQWKIKSSKEAENTNRHTRRDRKDFDACAKEMTVGSIVVLSSNQMAWKISTGNRGSTISALLIRFRGHSEASLSPGVLFISSVYRRFSDYLVFFCVNGCGKDRECPEH
jgi:hypothetical protein